MSKLDNQICRLTKDELGEIKHFFTDLEELTTEQDKQRRFGNFDQKKIIKLQKKMNLYNKQRDDHLNIFTVKYQEIEQEYSDKILSLINYYNELTKSLIEDDDISKDSLILFYDI